MRTWTFGEHLALLGPECFFDGEQALALHVGPFNLAHVDSWVQ